MLYNEGEGVNKKSTIHTLPKKLKIVDHPSLLKSLKVFIFHCIHGVHKCNQSIHFHVAINKVPILLSQTRIGRRPGFLKSLYVDVCMCVHPQGHKYIISGMILNL